eukprot:TRINITY_DN91996_c0_g1_i1.p1 TRINITY_DN91996_c0_g1~~TRINITY_DN91996_c0_g1_i1.p1  ORF type:complete len:863 (-),score=191.91 TRINITY_DN91996_c0_g1_i1:59-2647(-)
MSGRLMSSLHWHSNPVQIHPPGKSAGRPAEGGIGSAARASVSSEASARSNGSVNVAAFAAPLLQRSDIEAHRRQSSKASSQHQQEERLADLEPSESPADAAISHVAGLGVANGSARRAPSKTAQTPPLAASDHQDEAREGIGRESLAAQPPHSPEAALSMASPGHHTSSIAEKASEEADDAGDRTLLSFCRDSGAQMNRAFADSPQQDALKDSLQLVDDSVSEVLRGSLQEAFTSLQRSVTALGARLDASEATAAKTLQQEQSAIQQRLAEVVTSVGGFQGALTECREAVKGSKKDFEECRAALGSLMGVGPEGGAGVMKMAADMTKLQRDFDDFQKHMNNVMRKMAADVKLTDEVVRQGGHRIERLEAQVAGLHGALCETSNEVILLRSGSASSGAFQPFQPLQERLNYLFRPPDSPQLGRRSPALGSRTIPGSLTLSGRQSPALGSPRGAFVLDEKPRRATSPSMSGALLGMSSPLSETRSSLSVAAGYRQDPSGALSPQPAVSSAASSGLRLSTSSQPLQPRKTFPFMMPTAAPAWAFPPSPAGEASGSAAQPSSVPPLHSSRRATQPARPSSPSLLPGAAQARPELRHQGLQPPPRARSELPMSVPSLQPANESVVLSNLSTPGLTSRESLPTASFGILEMSSVIGESTIDDAAATAVTIHKTALQKTRRAEPGGAAPFSAPWALGQSWLRDSDLTSPASGQRSFASMGDSFDAARQTAATSSRASLSRLSATDNKSSVQPGGGKLLEDLLQANPFEVISGPSQLPLGGEARSSPPVSAHSGGGIADAAELSFSQTRQPASPSFELRAPVPMPLDRLTERSTVPTVLTMSTMSPPASVQGSPVVTYRGVVPALSRGPV